MKRLARIAAHAKIAILATVLPARIAPKKLLRFATAARVAQTTDAASAPIATIAEKILILTIYVPIARNVRITVANASIAAVVAQLWNTPAVAVRTGQSAAVAVPIAKAAANLFLATYAGNANGVPIVARAKRVRDRHSDSKSKNPPMRKAIKRIRANAPCQSNWNCALCQKSLR